MTEFVSENKVVPYSDSIVYEVVSDLSNLELAKDKIKKNNELEDFTFDADSCTVSVQPVGKIRFEIVERIPNSSVKFRTQQIPFALTMQIQLSHIDNDNTELKLFVNAELNAFLGAMVSKPLQQAIGKVADMLATLPYDEILNKTQNSK